jgi:hypothetical protein
MTQRAIETLSEAECFDLIKQEAIGRFVFQDAEVSVVRTFGADRSVN